MIFPIKRRTFGGMLLSACAMSFGASDKRNHMEPFHWARIKFDNLKATEDNWDAVPHADIVFLNELKKATNLNIDTTRYVVSMDNLEEMCEFPFLFMTSDGALELHPSQAANLMEYLKRGGFLLADDCVANDGVEREDAFFLDLKEKIEHMAGRPMVQLPDNHEIYHSFYDLDGLPYIQGVAHKGQALFIDGRMAAFLTSTDIHCGWQDYYMKTFDGVGWYPGVDSSKAIKMGVNIFMYVMSH